MLDMDNSLLLNPALELFGQTETGQRILRAVNTLEHVQETIYATANADSRSLLSLRVGTVLILAVCNRLKPGQRVNELSKEAWAEIAHDVSEYAVKPDGQAYTLFVFNLYAQYIDISAAVIEDRELAGEAQLAAIRLCAAALYENGRLLQEDAITESAYVQECLWIALDAMLKLLVVWFVPQTAGEDYHQLAVAAETFAVEYARYLLYSKENALLSQYLEQQRVLDEQLQAQYESYLQELTAETERVQALMRRAFDGDFREQLRGSAEFARAVGVEESNILSSEEDIDAFFLE